MTSALVRVVLSGALTITVEAIAVEPEANSTAACVGADVVMAKVFTLICPFSTLINVYK